MRIIQDLEGNLIPWKFKSNKEKTNESKLHQQIYKLLKEEFPTLHLLEECGIPIRPKQTLFLDFYIPLINLALEAHGPQHYKYNSFFFSNKLEFYRAQRRDREKIEFCELNNIILLELTFEESYDEWRNKIRQR